MSSCSHATSPLNLITNTNILDKCSVVCEYKANYPVCRGILKNKGNHLSILLDKCGANAYYNNQQFTLEEVKIFAPSLHKWGGKQSEAELIIIHKIKQQKKDAPDKLFVCIPLTGGSASNDWFSFLPMTPEYFKDQAKTVDINLPGWTLNTILPKGDYYNYQGTSPFENCSSVIEYIVYSLEQAAIIKTNLLELLRASLPKQINLMTREYKKDRLHKLYYHTNQSSSKSANEDVYLDCAMVDGDSPDQKEEEIKTTSFKSSELEKKMMDLPYKNILIVGGSIVFMIILIKTWNKFH